MTKKSHQNVGSNTTTHQGGYGAYRLIPVEKILQLVHHNACVMTARGTIDYETPITAGNF